MYIETPAKELINLTAVSKITVEELPHSYGKESSVFIVFYGLDGKSRIATIEFENKEKAKKWMVKQIYATALKISK